MILVYSLSLRFLCFVYYTLYGEKNLVVAHFFILNSGKIHWICGILVSGLSDFFVDCRESSSLIAFYSTPIEIKSFRFSISFGVSFDKLQTSQNFFSIFLKFKFVYIEMKKLMSHVSFNSLHALLLTTSLHPTLLIISSLHVLCSFSVILAIGLYLLLFFFPFPKTSFRFNLLFCHFCLLIYLFLLKISSDFIHLFLCSFSNFLS